ncbi:hypothetical protein NYE69_19300 [Paenibacillus sp. FSL R5-0527]
MFEIYEQARAKASSLAFSDQEVLSLLDKAVVDAQKAGYDKTTKWQENKQMLEASK